MTVKEYKEKQIIINYHIDQVKKMLEDNIKYEEAYNKLVETRWEKSAYDKFNAGNYIHHSKEKIKRHRMFINELLSEFEKISYIEFKD